MKVILLNLLRRAISCVIASAFFAFLHWLWGIIANKDTEFLGPFIRGAAGLFVIFTLYAWVSFAVEYVRLKRDPTYLRMKEHSGIKWKEYKRIKRERENERPQ